MFVSYNGGVDWTGPCSANGFPTQRQDITGLELTNMGGGVTRIFAASRRAGLRPPSSTTSGTTAATALPGEHAGERVPDVHVDRLERERVRLRHRGPGSQYTTGAAMNAGSGVLYVNPTTGNQLGRIDIAVAPSNPNVMYAQVQSIAGNNAGSCGGAPGCQLGRLGDHQRRRDVVVHGRLAGPLARRLRLRLSAELVRPGLAVDPNNPDRLFVDTYDIWFATRTGSTFTDLTCGYNGTQGRVVHVDQHALTFVNGSSSILLAGSDGGMFSTLNADVAPTMPTWINMVGGLNTIEFYSGDISGYFASSPTCRRRGRAGQRAERRLLAIQPARRSGR